MNRSKFTTEQLRQIDKARAYWGTRLEDLTHRIEDAHEEKLLKLLKKEYQRAQREIKKQIEELYFDLLENGSISTTDLYQYGRFKNLSNNLNKELQQLGSKEYDLIKKELEYAYLEALGTMPKEFGLIDFALPNKKALERIVLTEWAGRNFSDSIWQNKTKMLISLEKNIRDCISLGYSKDKAIQNIMYATGKQFSDVERLVRTELMHILNDANDTVAKEAGWNFKQWLTAKDERVCSTCIALEDDVFPVDAPVYTHPRCRCTFIYLKNYSEKGVLNSGEGGIINKEGLHRKKAQNNVEPMPKKQLQRIVKRFKQNGGIMQMNEATDKYLESKLAEAITYNEKTILLKQKPGRASVFEELIHASQYKQGINDGSYGSRLKCEISAQEKLIKYQKAYRLTKEEVVQTQKALKSYQKELDEYLKNGGG